MTDKKAALDPGALHESLTLEQQQELLEKYDLESNQRNPQNFMKHIIYFGLLAFTLFKYTRQFSDSFQRKSSVRFT